MSILLDRSLPATTYRYVIERLPAGCPIAIDCETTGLHPYQGDTLRGFSVAFRHWRNNELISFYVPVGYPEGNLDEVSLRALCAAIKGRDPLYVYHHSKFDMRFLRQLFPVPEPGKLWDTKVVAWLMDENLSNSLDPQAELHLGEKKSDYMKKLVKERGGWDKLTAEDTAEYGARDAELTLRLYERQREMIFTDHPLIHGNPAPAIPREMQLQGLLLRVEDNGILMDTGYLEELTEKAKIEVGCIEERFVERYAVNVNSPQQVAVLLFETLDVKRKDGKETGKVERYEAGVDRDGVPIIKAKYPTVARSVLESLEDHPVVEDLLHHRRLKKAITAYLVPLQEHTAPDGRVHPTFWSTGTKTGRLSCSDPNLQTIPRGDTLVGVRAAFVAEQGYELWEYDLNSAEMRVVAGMADEQVLIDGLNAGTDMHAKLAQQVFGLGFTGIQRRYAKNIGYGFFYGLTSPVTAAKYISGPNAGRTAKKILDGLRELYPNVVTLMKREERRASRDGVVAVGHAWPGRYRRFVTEAPLKPFPYTALNAQVQGGIGEFMKDVMLNVEAALNAAGARLLLQVHDSLVIEVPEGKGVLVGDLLQITADDCNPFKMPMIFEGNPWGAHD
jgi:DNA polymerase-1